MKKLLLVAALGVAGFASANENIKKSVDLEKETKQKEETKNERGEFISCITYTMSCGWTGFACGYSFDEIIKNIQEADTSVCGE